MRADLGGAGGIEGMNEQDSTNRKAAANLADSAASPLERSNVQQSDPFHIPLHHMLYRQMIAHLFLRH
jgi:hypothetical protein